MRRVHRFGVVFGVLSLSCLTAMSTAVPASAAQKPPEKPQKPEPKPPQKPDAKPTEAKAPPKPVAIGEEVDSAIALNDTDGKAHALKDYRGKTLVVAMWSIDSAECKQYQERLKKLSDEFADKGVVVLAVDPNANELDSGAEPYKRMKEYTTKNPIGATLVTDPGDKLVDKLGARTTPEVFVIDAKGMLRYKGAFDDDPKSEKADKATPYAHKAVEEVLAGKPVTTPTTIAAGSAIKVAPKPDAKKPEPPKHKPEDKPAPKKKG